MTASNVGLKGTPRLVTAAVTMACLIIIAAGCGSHSQDSELLHEIGKPTRGTQKWMWSDVSDRSYHDVITPLLSLDNSKYLPGTHELTTWTQAWVDRLDSKIRREHPEALVNTPKPVAKVIKQGSANAFVAPVPVCYNVNVKLKSGTASSANTVDNVYLDAREGEFSAWPSEYKCVGGSDDIAEVKSFVTAYNAASAGCKFSVNSAGTLEGNSQCARNTDIGDKVAARKLVLLQTANYVTVHTGIFALMTEEALIAVIAHELGHYYRSHVAGAMKEFDFFYTMGRHNTTGRPVAEPGKKEMGDNAVAASTLINGSDTYTTISSQKIRPELFMAVGSVIAKICTSTSCPATCKTADSLMKNSDFVSATSTYPFADATPAMTASYRDFETKALACLSNIKMSSNSTTITANSIGYAKFVSYIDAPIWPTWLGRISDGGKRFVQKMNKLAVSRSGTAAPSGQTLNDVVSALSKKMKSQDDAGEASLQLAYDSRLGQYTAEQEADEEAAEWVNDIGIEPKHVVDAMRRLGKGTSTSLRGFVLSEADCEARWNRNWLNTDGSYAFVPVGDYSEVHHSSCFRMFNLDREISAHRYQTPAVNLPLLSASEWRSLQIRAANLATEESVSGGGGGAPVAAFMKQSSMGACPFSHSYH